MFPINSFYGIFLQVIISCQKQYDKTSHANDRNFVHLLRKLPKYFICNRHK